MSIGVVWRWDRLAKVGRGTRVSWEAGRGGVPTEHRAGGAYLPRAGGAAGSSCLVAERGAHTAFSLRPPPC